MTQTIDTVPAASDYADLIDQLSLEEKVHLLTGETAFTLPGNERIGLAPLAFSDGPTGVRGLKFIGGDPVALFPNATLVSGSWDDGISEEVGILLSEEARRQNIHVVLGPTVNLHRTPLGGRLFEAFSEDPYLTGRVATAYVRGLQKNGTGACLKHLVANESETLRNFMDSSLSEEALREVYLLPFEMAVQDAGAWSMMSAYNHINGVHATEHDHIQNGIVKDAWSWDGLIMSDWLATKRTVESANGGLDLVMPGPNGPWGENLVAAVRAGRVSEDTVNGHLTRLLRLAERTGALTREGDLPQKSGQVMPAPGSAVRSEQLCRIAARGMVVLKNRKEALPLPTESNVALIGRHGIATQNMGGGSARVNPIHQVSIAHGLESRLGERLAVYDGVGVRNSPVPADPALLRHPGHGKAGIDLVLHAADGTELERRHETSTELAVGASEGYAAVPTKVTATAVFAGESSEMSIGGIGAGHWKITVGDRVIESDLAADGIDPGESAMRPPSFRQKVYIESGSLVTYTVDVPPVDWRSKLLADDSLGLVEESHLLEMGADRYLALALARIPDDEDELLAGLEVVAARAGTAVVVVGLTEEQETEAADKSTLALPGRQDEMVFRVAAVATRTIVVVNAATPVLMPWLDAVDAVMAAGIPGQEGGNAVAAALLGEIEPSGRLVTSYPAADGAAPAWEVVPNAERVIEYTDGTAVGYRGYDRGDAPEPLFWFGHGLGYGTWEYAEATLLAPVTERGPVVRVTVKNLGTRTSREVVQVYYRPSEADQPVRLAGYEGVEVPPGASASVDVAADARLFRRWDGGSGTWIPLLGGELLIARGLGDVRARVSLGA